MASSRKPARNRKAVAGSLSAPDRGTIEGALRAALVGAGARGAAVCVALSGGIDSVVLLHSLAALAGRHRLRLSAMHVNHALSPNAYLWERHCRAFCNGLRVPLVVRRVKVPARRKGGLEAAARAARYTALAAARADFVVLAHQRDDQAETVLMNLLRGTGLRGAAAMPLLGPLPVMQEDAPKALRPLLSVPRETIVAYATAHRLRWEEDDSNADESLSRNWLRRRIGPLIAARYPRWRESLARAAAHFAEAQALIGAPASEARRAQSPDRLGVDTLRAACAARRKLLLRDFLRANGVRAPAARRLDEMLRQVLCATPDAAIAVLHDGLVLRRFRTELAVLPQAAPPGQTWGEVLLHPCRGAGLDAAKLQIGPLSVRVRQGGERLRLAANRPAHTLKNLFQAAGIAPWERDSLPLLYCGEDLVWVPGLGMAAAYRAQKGQAGLLPEWSRIRDA